MELSIEPGPSFLPYASRGASFARSYVSAFPVLFGQPDFSIEVFGTPKPAGSKKAFAIKKGGAYTGRTVVVDANPNSKDWKKEVAHQVGAAWQRPASRRPFMALLDFQVLRPKGHMRKGGTLSASAPEHPTVRPDLLKLARAIEDAIQGTVYHNDAQIVLEPLAKRYSLDREGLTLSLWELAE